MLQGAGKLHVLYIVAADIKQLANGLLVIAFPADPFKQGEPCQCQGRAADCHVIVEPLELPAQLQQGLACFKAALD